MSECLRAIPKTYDLLKWLLPLVSKFPRDKKYTLGQRLENELLDILALLLEANFYGSAESATLSPGLILEGHCPASVSKSAPA